MAWPPHDSAAYTPLPVHARTRGGLALEVRFAVATFYKRSRLLFGLCEVVTATSLVTARRRLSLEFCNSATLPSLRQMRGAQRCAVRPPRSIRDLAVPRAFPLFGANLHHHLAPRLRGLLECVPMG